MSKVICDICGTTYPETASQCPICGYAKPANAQTVTGDTTQIEGTGSSGYTYVKGGRFSKSNVRKRNKANPVPQGRREAKPQRNEVVEEKKSNRALMIIVIALLLAIVTVAIYIALRFFWPVQFGDPNDSTSGTTTGPAATTTTPETTETTAPDLSCTGLELTDTVLEFDAVGEAWLLNPVAQPENTTDTITYQSSDTSIATVTSEGRVTAVAPGQAVITITCGSITVECQVNCNFETVPPTTEETVEPTTEPQEVLELNREEFALAYEGDSWQVYDGPISNALINWSVSDSSVIRVDNGEVIAVGPGYAYVYAEYNGMEDSCIVYCQFGYDDEESGGESGEVSEDGGDVSSEE